MNTPTSKIQKVGSPVKLIQATSVNTRDEKNTEREENTEAVTGWRWANHQMAYGPNSLAYERNKISFIKLLRRYVRDAPIRPDPTCPYAKRTIVVRRRMP